MNIESKPRRHENDYYAKMSPEMYLAEVYKRACRVATMLKSKQVNNDIDCERKNN